MQGKCGRYISEAEIRAGVDTKRAVNGAAGSTRTVNHVVITGNTNRRARPEGGEGREERGSLKKEHNLMTCKTALGERSKAKLQNYTERADQPCLKITMRSRQKKMNSNKHFLTTISRIHSL